MSQWCRRVMYVIFTYCIYRGGHFIGAVLELEMNHADLKMVLFMDLVYGIGGYAA